MIPSVMTKKNFLAILQGVSPMCVHVAKRFEPFEAQMRIFNRLDIRLLCSKLRNHTFAKAISKHSPGYSKWGSRKNYHSFLLSTVTRKKNESDRSVEARAEKRSKKFDRWLDESGLSVYATQKKGKG